MLTFFIVLLAGACVTAWLETNGQKAARRREINRLVKAAITKPSPRRRCSRWATLGGVQPCSNR